MYIQCNVVSKSAKNNLLKILLEAEFPAIAMKGRLIGEWKYRANGTKIN